MKSIKKRFLVGMLTGALIFAGGLIGYKFLDSSILDDIQQISAIKQMMHQAGKIAKISNKDVENVLESIKI